MHKQTAVVFTRETSMPVKRVLLPLLLCSLVVFLPACGGSSTDVPAGVSTASTPDQVVRDWMQARANAEFDKAALFHVKDERANYSRNVAEKGPQGTPDRTLHSFNVGAATVSGDRATVPTDGYMKDKFNQLTAFTLTQVLLKEDGLWRISEAETARLALSGPSRK